MAADDLVTLRRAQLELILAPAAGGSIYAFRHVADGHVVELMRPAFDPESRDPLEMACFPLVPFSNRIAGGRFSFRGRETILPPNMPPEPHAIHGHGWKAPWTVERASETSALLAYEHAADAWPWTYRATQDFRLAAEGLEVELTIENRSPEAMPAGFGLHPYFPKPPGARFMAQVGEVWLSDASMIPTRREPPPPEWNFGNNPLLDAVTVDNCFVGWDGAAVIETADASIAMTATAPMRSLVVYAPRGETYFCAEPVSNVNDAFNMAARGEPDTGMLILEPGEAARGTVRFRPRVA